jgi:glutamate-1-semialdehyde 2,1-aminomutase
MRGLTETARLYDAARNVIAGGVSSDIRRASGARPPLYVDHARGSRLWDVDGNEYVDYVLGQGPLLFGHSHPVIVEAVTRQLSRGQIYSAQHALEVEVAELVCELVPCAELVRFNSVGSEAVQAAWRLARGLTGRTKVLKFEGHYHGWYDPAWFSVHPAPAEAGPADRPRPVPGSLGQLGSAAAELIVAPWNDLPAFERILDEHAGEVAAVVMEPLLCNSGCIEPKDGFLAAVRERTRRDGIVLIFDEVITGFRLAPGGAQQWYDVVPDLAVFGKAIAGGFPLSCIAGREDVMRPIVTGAVGHAGTFNSNPVVMAAAAAALGLIKKEGDALYEPLRERGRRLAGGIADRARAAGVDVLAAGPGPMVQTYHTSRPAVDNYRDFAAVDRARTQRFHAALLEEGVNSVARGLWFLSTAHDDTDIDQTLAAVERVLADPHWIDGET